MVMEMNGKQIICRHVKWNSFLKMFWQNIILGPRYSVFFGKI
jgi:hypothetical protein